MLVNRASFLLMSARLLVLNVQLVHSVPSNFHRFALTALRVLLKVLRAARVATFVRPANTHLCLLRLTAGTVLSDFPQLNLA